MFYPDGAPSNYQHIAVKMPSCSIKYWERDNKLIMSYKDDDVFNNGMLYGSLQFFGNYNLNVPIEIQQQAKQLVAQKTTEYLWFVSRHIPH
jgi:hypothetical protein